MRRRRIKRHFLAAPIVCLAVPVMAASALNASTDVAEIKAFEQRNAEQLNSAVLAETYAPDAVVLDYMTGGIYQGRPAIEEAFAKQLAPLAKSSANIREHNLVTDGQFACDMQTTDFRFEDRSGKTGSLSLRQMDALQKIGGKWQVVQEQVAALNDPQTGNAVMNDLQVRGDMVWPADMTLGKPLSPAQANKEIATWTNESMRVVGIDAILAYYGPREGEVAMYSPTVPGNVRGKAEMRAYYTPSMNSFESLNTKTPILKIDTDGVLGAQLDVQDIVLHLRDGKTQSLYWRQSDCVRRVGDKWYGILDMASFPVDLKTGKTDSKWSSFPVDTKPAR
jgi:ketosteroid isomerase-like protein